MNVPQNVLFNSDDVVVDVPPLYWFENEVNEFVVYKVLVQFDDGRIIQFFEDVNLIHSSSFALDRALDDLDYPAIFASFVDCPPNDGIGTAVDPSGEMVFLVHDSDVALDKIREVHVELGALMVVEDEGGSLFVIEEGSLAAHKK